MGQVVIEVHRGYRPRGMLVRMMDSEGQVHGIAEAHVTIVGSYAERITLLPLSLLAGRSRSQICNRDCICRSEGLFDLFGIHPGNTEANGSASLGRVSRCDVLEDSRGNLVLEEVIEEVNRHSDKADLSSIMEGHHIV